MKNIHTKLKEVLFSIILFAVLSVITAPSYAIEQKSAVFADGDGAIYAINSAGLLRWYQHAGRFLGAISWTAGSGNQVGVGWAAGVQKVFSGGDGVVYGIRSNGDLLWYRHDGRFDGSSVWVNGGLGKKVGNGWQNFLQVFSGGDGVIYAILPNGSLRWYRHTGWLNGENTWAAGSGGQIGVGWQSFTKVFSGDNGVIYGILPNGDMRWYLHTGKLTGAGTWASSSGARVGVGWNTARQVFSSGDGIIYATTPTGQLWWYRHKGWLTGTNSWVFPTGKTIGTGWIFP